MARIEEIIGIVVNDNQRRDSRIVEEESIKPFHEEIFLNDYPKAEEESVREDWPEGLPVENEYHHKGHY
jgi:hypothetical protein